MKNWENIAVTCFLLMPRFLSSCAMSSFSCPIQPLIVSLAQDTPSYLRSGPGPQLMWALGSDHESRVLGSYPSHGTQGVLEAGKKLENRTNLLLSCGDKALNYRTLLDIFDKSKLDLRTNQM